MRTLASALVLFGLVLSTAVAQAETLTGISDQNCRSGVADVRTWRPEYGPPAAFIANAYTSAEGTLFIGLGFDKTGYWSVENHTGSDASDEGGALYLAHTSFDGARRLHRVYDGSEHASFNALEALADESPEQRVARFQALQRDVIKKRLFSLAAGRWKVESLTHDYRLGTPKRDDDGKIADYTGWFAEAAKRGKPTLRFGIVGDSFMCWCSYGWRGYVLAPPKKTR